MADREERAIPLLDGPGGDGASLERVRAGLAERLRSRRSEIGEAVFARFRALGFDPAEGEDAEYVAGSRAAVTETVDYGLGAIERGEEWFGAIPPAAVAQARRAARKGVNLDKVLLRNNAGHTVLEDFVMQEVDVASQSIVLRGVFGTLGALLDHFTALLAHEYQREVERTAHLPELRRAERVQRLLAGAPVDTCELGYEFDAAAPRRDRGGREGGGGRSSPGGRTWARAVERLTWRGDRVGVVRWPADTRHRRFRAPGVGQGARERVVRSRWVGEGDRRMASHPPTGQSRDPCRAAPAAAAHTVCGCVAPRSRAEGP